MADDQLALSKAAFTQITGTLSGAQFAANASRVATDANDRIIYETDTGRLLYDSYGSAGCGAVQFALLAGAPAITAADFFVF